MHTQPIHSKNIEFKQKLNAQRRLFDDERQSAFAKYHADNPHIYAMFKRFTFEAIAAGRKYFSAEAIINQIRWHTMVTTKGDCFKLNNDYKAFFSRLFAAEHPEHSDFFRFRKSKADDEDFVG